MKLKEEPSRHFSKNKLIYDNFLLNMKSKYGSDNYKVKKATKIINSYYEYSDPTIADTEIVKNLIKLDHDVYAMTLLKWG